MPIFFDLLEEAKDLTNKARAAKNNNSTFSQKSFLHKEEYDKAKNEMNYVERIVKQWLGKRYTLKEFFLSKDLPSYAKDAHAFFRMVIAPNEAISVTSVTQTPQETYQQNKTSSTCVGCGAPTIQIAVLSSIIGYCKKCSG